MNDERLHVYCPYCAGPKQDVDTLRDHLTNWHGLGAFTSSKVAESIASGLESLDYDDQAAVPAGVEQL